MTTRKQTETRAQRRQAELDARREARRHAPARRGLSLPLVSAVAVVGGAIVIAVAIALGGGSRPSGQVDPIIARAPAGLTTSGFVLGKADAPVAIDIYEDFQCPACRNWGETVLPSLAANELLGGQARLVFHDFAFIGPESFGAARAAAGAANQGRFWDMWATIYANQGQENRGALSRPRLIAMAAGLGLDVNRLTSDMDSVAAASQVDASIAAARQLGVTSTPTIVINGRLLTGASYSDIAAAIAQAAAR